MYYVQLYINGALDIEVKFNELVVGNDGPIHFFKDVSHQGAFYRN